MGIPPSEYQQWDQNHRRRKALPQFFGRGLAVSVGTIDLSLQAALQLQPALARSDMESLPFETQSKHATGILEKTTIKNVKRSHSEPVVIDLCSSSSSELGSESESESEVLLNPFYSDQISDDHRRNNDLPHRKRQKLDDSDISVYAVRPQAPYVGEGLALEGLKQRGVANKGPLSSKIPDQNLLIVETEPSLAEVAQKDSTTDPVIKAETQGTGVIEPAFGTNDNGRRTWFETIRSSWSLRNWGSEAPPTAMTGSTLQSSKMYSTSNENQSQDDRSTSMVDTPYPAKPNITLAPMAHRPNPYEISHIARKKAADIQLEPRLELFKTESGISENKLIGPFVIEDSDDDDKDSNKPIEIRSCEDERNVFSSFGTILHPPNYGYNIQKGDEELIDDRKDIELLGSEVFYKRKTTKIRRHGFDVRLLNRRRQSEDKCANRSQKMRAETLSRRKNEEAEVNLNNHLYEEMKIEQLCKDQLVGSASQAFGGATTASAPEVRGATNIDPSVSPKPYDDLIHDLKYQNDGRPNSAEYPNSTSITQTQVDLGQNVAHNHGSSQSLTSLASAAPCPRFSSPDLVLPYFSPARVAHLHDDRANGETRQVDDDRTSMPVDAEIDPKSKTEQPVGRPRVAEKKETSRAAATHNEASTDAIGFAEGTNARGTESTKDDNIVVRRTPPPVRDSLKAARNESGGLAMLAKRATEQHNPVLNGNSSAGQQAKTSRSLHRSGLPSNRQRLGDDDHRDDSIDSTPLTTDGDILSRKRNVTSLMATLTETARCWWLTKASVTPRQRSGMKSNLLEVTRGFAHPLLRGQPLPIGGVRRLGDIKHNMLRRSAQHHTQTSNLERNPDQWEIEATLIELIGKGMLLDVEQLLHHVTKESEIQRQQQTRTRKPKKKPVKYSQDLRPTGLPRRVEVIKFDDDYHTKSVSCDQDLRLSNQQKVAWEREEEKIKQLSQTLAIYENVGGASGNSPPVRGSNSSHTNIWEDDGQSTAESEDQESDEDQDGTAPSFGRSKEDDVENDVESSATRTTPTETRQTPAHGRKSVSGKGLLTQIRQRYDAQTSRPIHDTANATQEEAAIDAQTSRSPSVDQPEENTNIRSSTGSPSVQPEELIDTPQYNGTHLIQHDILADYEDFPGFFNAECVSLGTHMDAEAAQRQMNRVVTDVAALTVKRYRDARIIWDVDDYGLVSQTVILNTGGQCRVELAKSRIPVTEWPGRLQSQQVGPRATARPTVLYVVHETKTTTTTTLMSSTTEADAEDGNDVVSKGNLDNQPSRRAQGGYNHHINKSHPLIERESDMHFSDRSCANKIAKERFLASIRGSNHKTSSVDEAEEEADDDDDDEDDDNTNNDEAERPNPAATATATANTTATIPATDLDTYMDELKQDKACFERQHSSSIITHCRSTNEITRNGDVSVSVSGGGGEGGNGKEGKEEEKKMETEIEIEIRIWVEEIIIDLDLTWD